MQTTSKGVPDWLRTSVDRKASAAAHLLSSNEAWPCIQLVDPDMTAQYGAQIQHSYTAVNTAFNPADPLLTATHTQHNFRKWVSKLTCYMMLCRVPDCPLHFACSPASTSSSPVMQRKRPASTLTTAPDDDIQKPVWCLDHKRAWAKSAKEMALELQHTARQLECNGKKLRSTSRFIAAKQCNDIRMLKAVARQKIC